MTSPEHDGLGGERAPQPGDGPDYHADLAAYHRMRREVFVECLSDQGIAGVAGTPDAIFIPARRPSLWDMKTHLVCP